MVVVCSAFPLSEGNRDLKVEPRGVLSLPWREFFRNPISSRIDICPVRYHTGSSSVLMIVSLLAVGSPMGRAEQGTQHGA